jgi:hypothetical protein
MGLSGRIGDDYGGISCIKRAYRYKRSTIVCVGVASSTPVWTTRSAPVACHHSLALLSCHHRLTLPARVLALVGGAAVLLRQAQQRNQNGSGRW